MNWKIIFTTFLIFLQCIIVQSQTISHIVSRGETIESIAKQYNVSANDIIKANPNGEGIIYVGMKLLIPQDKMIENQQPNNLSSSEVSKVPETKENQKWETYGKEHDKLWRFKFLAGITSGQWIGSDFTDGTVKSDYGTTTVSNKSVCKFHIGITADYLFNKNVYVGGGLLFNQNGYKQEVFTTSGQYWVDDGANFDDMKSIKMSASKIDIPIHIGGIYRFTSNMNIFAEVGPYVSYTITGNRICDQTFIEYEDIHSSATERNTIKEEIGKESLKDYQKIGYGISASAGISIYNILILFSYQHGLSKIIKDTKQYEQNLLFSIGYEF